MTERGGDVVSRPAPWFRRSPPPWRAAARALAISFLAACDTAGGPPPPPKSTAMDHGVAARVGELRVSLSSVGRVAAAQRVTPAAARDALVRDALFAAGALEAKVDRQPATALAVDASLARALLRSLLAEAEQAGPITDDELRDTTARHWLELDRPDASRTVHALVRAKGKGKADVPARVLVEAAQVLARDLAALGREAASIQPPSAPGPGRPPPEDPVVAKFKEAATASFERAKAQSGRADLELVAEGLPPVSADGRVLTPQPGAFDETFARTASKLQARGDLSAPTETQFGVHVIMLLERLPGHVVPAEERRALLREEVVAMRATALRDRLLEQLRAGLEIDRSADALLALVSVEQ
jgi:peptidyl-prolyl cis-trans isomerase C